MREIEIKVKTMEITEKYGNIWVATFSVAHFLNLILELRLANFTFNFLYLTNANKS